MQEFKSRHAFEHLDKLGYEIGPRLAGTRGERHAAGYIENHFKGCGLSTRVQRFRFVSRATRNYLTASLVSIGFISTLKLPPFPSLVVFISTLLLCRLLPPLMPKRESQNVIGTLGPKKAGKRVLITAHYDSAACLISRRLNLFTRLALRPLSLIFLILLFVRLLGALSPWWIAWAIFAAVFLPTCLGRLFTDSRRKISPGANDNASGVAVMLEVARVAAESPPLGARLTLAAFGAEEQGLKGSRVFAARERIPKDTLALNLDCVGVGPNLYLIEGNGIFRRCRTSSRANQLVRECCRRERLKAKPAWTIFASSDYFPLLRAGSGATSLIFDKAHKDRLSRAIGRIFRIPNLRTRWDPRIHTMEDVPDKIEIDNIEKAGRVTLGFIKFV